MTKNNHSQGLGEFKEGSSPSTPDTNNQGCGKLIRKTNRMIDDFICGQSGLLCSDCMSKKGCGKEFEVTEQVIIMSFGLERFATILKANPKRLRLGFFDTKGDYIKCWRNKEHVRKF